MKKIFLIMLFAVSGACSLQVNAQCQCCGSMSGFSGGEFTPGAVSLGKGNWLAELYGDTRFFKGISNERQVREFGVSTSSATVVDHMAIAVAGLRYGISDKLVLLVQQPLFNISGPTANSKTIGDMLSLFNYTALNRGGYVLDLQAGMEWPTGTAVHFGNGSSVSTGSGSYDPVAGVSVKKNFTRSFVRAAGFFKYTTRGFNDVYYGNFCSHQLNYTYILSKSGDVCAKPDSAATKAVKPVYSVGLQLQGEWAQMQMLNNMYLENTGSYLALGAVSFAMAYKNFSVPLTLSVPLYQHYHGLQNMAVIRVRVGITKTFN